MQLDVAEKIALAYYKKIGLLDAGWTFGFDNAKRRIGVTKFGPKTITISRYFTQVTTVANFEQVLIHEGAHAMLPPKAHHKTEWQRLARSMGYTHGTTMRNPYWEAEVRAGRMGKKTPRKPVNAVLPPKNAPKVDIGSVLTINGKNYTVFKKARTSWHARRNATSTRYYRVPFNVAYQFLAR